MKPHKGGRQERLYLRVDPELKHWLMGHCDAHGISVADFVEAKIMTAMHLEQMLIDVVYMTERPGKYFPVIVPTNTDETLDNQDDL